MYFNHASAHLGREIEGQGGSQSGAPGRTPGVPLILPSTCAAFTTVQ